MRLFILLVAAGSLMARFTFAQKSDPINVATYNLRYNNKSDGVNA